MWYVVHVIEVKFHIPLTALRCIYSHDIIDSGLFFPKNQKKLECRLDTLICTRIALPPPPHPHTSRLPYTAHTLNYNHADTLYVVRVMCSLSVWPEVKTTNYKVVRLWLSTYTAPCTVLDRIGVNVYWQIHTLSLMSRRAFPLIIAWMKPSAFGFFAARWRAVSPSCVMHAGMQVCEEEGRLHDGYNLDVCVNLCICTHAYLHV